LQLVERYHRKGAVLFVCSVSTQLHSTQPGRSIVGTSKAHQTHDLQVVGSIPHRARLKQRKVETKRFEKTNKYGNQFFSQKL